VVSLTPLVVSVVASGLAAACAAADGAILSLDPDAPDLGDESRALIARREKTHRALAFARVAAHLTAGASLARALGLGSMASGQAIAIGFVAAFVAVLISESVARSAGDRLGERAVHRLMPFIRMSERTLAIVVAIGTAIERGLDRMLPPKPPDEEARDATAEQFREIVAAEADVSREEEALLHGVFELGDTQVHEIMVPRVDIVALARETPWSEVVDRVRSSEHARLPVYDETIDNVVGILHAKDLLPAVVEGVEPAAGWDPLVRPAEFIPGTKAIDQQLRDFQATGTHIAIVVDEFGGTAGLVTIEDVLEEIVGEIHDEYDVEEAPLAEEDGKRYWVSGRVTLEELSDVDGHDFKRDDETTVGGLIYELLGRVPKAGEELVLDGFRVVIERVRRRRVERVYFERPESVVGPAA
jgi:CBS domain containing-hemolysin-like protein